MRINFFVENYIAGGVERYYGDLISGLPARDFTVRLFVNPINGLSERLKMLIQRPIDWVPYQCLTNTKLDYELFKSNDMRHANVLTSCVKLITRIPVGVIGQMTLRQLLRRYPADVWHIINGGYPGAEGCRAAAFAARSLGSSKVIMSMLSYPFPRKTPLDAILDRQMVRTLDCIAPNSAFAGQGMTTLRGFPPNRVHPILSGTPPPSNEPEAGHRMRAELGLPESSILIGTVATLEPLKGHLVLLDAARQLCDEFPNVFFILSGDGIMRPQLEQYIQQHNLSQQVRLLGYRDARLLVNAFDLVAFPSLYEGLPFAIQEAMALAKPIVATNVGGIPEEIDDKVSGLLVPPHNSEALAQALRQLLRSPDRAAQMGQAAQDKYYRLFTPQHMVNAFVHLYGEVARSC